MNIKEYVKSLNQDKSYWQIDSGELKPLNDVLPTVDNLVIVFKCSRCHNFHAVPYTLLKIDEDGDYIIFCPDNDEKEKYEAWVFRCEIPEQLMKIFTATEFEKYQDSDVDEGDCDKEDDCEEKVTPENDKIKVTKKGKIKTTKIGYFFDCKKIV